MDENLATAQKFPDAGGIKMAYEYPNPGAAAPDWSRGAILYAVGALLNSALYLASVLVVGLIWSNSGAVLVALIAMGLTFLQYSAVLGSAHKRIVQAFWALSNVAGILAGLLLLQKVI